MTCPIVKIADNNDKVAEELIKIVKEVADQCAANDVIKIGLSGGSLPKFLAAGMKSDIGKSIPWSKVKFFFCDERMVPTEDPDSTLGLYLSLFKSLDDLDIKVEQFVSVAVNLDVDQAAADYEDKLKSLMGPDVQADLLLLGMGPDGHTCSLFPNHELLEENDKIVASIKDSPKPPPQRVTLTLPVLNKAKKVVFVSTGDGKKEMIKNILKDKNEAYPATRVRPYPGELIWIIDQAAAAHL